VALMNFKVFCDGMQRALVISYWHYGWAYCLGMVQDA